MNGTEYLGSGADIDVVTDRRDASPIETNRHLLKYEAIAANPRIGVNYDAVWVGYQKAPAYVRVEGNICARDSRPKPVSKNRPLSAYPYKDARSLLIVPYASDQEPTGIPGAARGAFARPVRRSDVMHGFGMRHCSSTTIQAETGGLGFFRPHA